MKVVISRVKQAEVFVKSELIGSCEKGYLILSCFTESDSLSDIDYIVKKIVNLRIFEDDSGKMNRNILEENGSILSISQFTLYAETKKGNRPSFIKALNGENAKELYNIFNNELNKYLKVETGIFGADMQINSVNDGPVTIIIDSKNK